MLTDQLLDQTRGREETFFEHGAAVQLSSAPMFDQTLGSLVRKVLTRQGVRVVDVGTTVVVNGHRFPQAAELRFYAAMGAALVNMTLLPETALARELGLAVLNVTTVTDLATEATGDGDANELEYMRRRAAQSQTVLLEALRELVQAIPDRYAPHQAFLPTGLTRCSPSLPRTVRSKQVTRAKGRARAGLTRARPHP